MKHLYFVRHGESELNAKGIYSGHLDTPLTQRGRKQAQVAGLKAKELAIGLIVSSPLIRAFETAKIIADEMGFPPENIVTNYLLAERFLGSLQGKPFSTGPEDPKLFSDIEPDEALTQRAQAALEYLRSLDAENILVASHGSFGRALTHCLNPSLDLDGIAELENSQIVQLV